MRGGIAATFGEVGTVLVVIFSFSVSYQLGEKKIHVPDLDIV